MTKEQQELIAEVLKYVNQARVALGMTEIMDLPKGERENPETCPVAQALAMEQDYFSVDNDWIDFGDEGYAQKVIAVWGDADGDSRYEHVRTPKPIAEFVNAFDDGKLSEYEFTTPDPDEDDDDEEEDINY